MNKRDIQRIRGCALEVAGLLAVVDVPPRRPTGDGTRDAIENAENLYRLKADYREKVEAILENDWVPIVRILESSESHPWLSRTERIRKAILDHTRPDDTYANWLEPHNGKFGPNALLESEIRNLADELAQMADMETQKRKRAALRKLMLAIGFVVALAAGLLQILDYIGCL